MKACLRKSYSWKKAYSMNSEISCRITANELWRSILSTSKMTPKTKHYKIFNFKINAIAAQAETIKAVLEVPRG